MLTWEYIYDLMRLAWAISLLALLSSGVYAQNEHQVMNKNTERLNYYFRLYSQSDGKLATPFGDLEDFVKSLESKRYSFKNDHAFVNHLFHKTRKKFFNRFEDYSTFRDLMSNGIYNCLTATSLIGILLQYFEIDYRIIETNYHVFILVDHGTILLETTDPDGFVDSQLRINELMAKYENLTIDKRVSAKRYYEYSFNRLDSVTPVGMLGLLHYNHAVKAYNEHMFSLAITHLQHAFLLHQSLKVEAFLELLTTTIKNTGLISDKDRSIYLQKLESIKAKKTIKEELTSNTP